MSDNETARSRLYNLYNEYTIYHNAHMGLWGESPVVKECNDWFKFEIGKALAIVKADKFIEQADGFVTDRQRTYLVNADDFDDIETGKVPSLNVSRYMGFMQEGKRL